MSEWIENMKEKKEIYCNTCPIVNLCRFYKDEEGLNILKKEACPLEIAINYVIARLLLESDEEE